jgi:hypothetical protein
MTHDRRRPPHRRSAALFVATSDGALPFARTRDLSATGVFLETGAAPPVGSRVEISIAWGESVQTCLARVVRVDRDGVALEFVDPDTFFLQAVAEIMAESRPNDVTPKR